MNNRREFLRDWTSLTLWAAMAPDVVLAEVAVGGGVKSELLSQASFLRCLDSTFRVVREGERRVDLTLTGVEDLAQRFSAGKDGVNRIGECFLLTLRGASLSAMPQGTYVFFHSLIGRFAMLITPVWSEDPRYCSYQAVFNRSEPSSVADPAVETLSRRNRSPEVG